jgi:cell division protein FtsX
MTGTEVLLTNVVIVVVGMVIGSIGSLVAIRRFLDV